LKKSLIQVDSVIKYCLLPPREYGSLCNALLAHGSTGDYNVISTETVECHAANHRGMKLQKFN
jgi:hypothetical protein